jgi:uncharacterized protein
VSQPRYPLRINVGFLINQPIGTSRDIHFDFPSVSLPPDFDTIDFQGVVRINRTPQGLLFQGEFNAKEREQCVRCLTHFWQPLHGEFEELYAFNPAKFSGTRPAKNSGTYPAKYSGTYPAKYSGTYGGGGGGDKTDTESESILPEDANVDLAPMAREFLLLDVPISPVCKPDCKGLCPECGADLNVSPCEHVLNHEQSGIHE